MTLCVCLALRNKSTTVRFQIFRADRTGTAGEIASQVAEEAMSQSWLLSQIASTSSGGQAVSAAPQQHIALNLGMSCNFPDLP